MRRMAESAKQRALRKRFGAAAAAVVVVVVVGSVGSGSASGSYGVPASSLELSMGSSVVSGMIILCVGFTTSREGDWRLGGGRSCAWFW